MLPGTRSVAVPRVVAPHDDGGPSPDANQAGHRSHGLHQPRGPIPEPGVPSEEPPPKRHRDLDPTVLGEPELGSVRVCDGDITVPAVHDHRPCPPVVRYRSVRPWDLHTQQRHCRLDVRQGRAPERRWALGREPPAVRDERGGRRQADGWHSRERHDRDENRISNTGSPHATRVLLCPATGRGGPCLWFDPFGIKDGRSLPLDARLMKNEMQEARRRDSAWRKRSPTFG